MLKVILIVAIILLVILFLVVTASFVSNIIFNQATENEVQDLFSNIETEKEIISNENLQGLPLPVQKWLMNSKVAGKEKIRTVYLKQNAMLRLKPESGWMPARAEQYFTADKPGFLWKAKVKAATFLYFSGRDTYKDGRGHMLIKVLSLIKVADAKGKEVDQGAMLRYLAEMVWFPTAALNNYIEWEEIDSNTAKATMSYGGVSASGVFKFNEKGEVINFTAERYGEFGGQYLMKTWSVDMTGHKEMSGFKIPTEGEVTWKLDSGDFTWYQFKVTGVEYNMI